MPIRLFDAPAGGGKTRALSRRAHALAEAGDKVLIIQPTQLLIDRTTADELEALEPSYSVRAIHGGTVGSVLRELIDHFVDAEEGVGEIVLATHAAFFLLPRFPRRSEWTLMVDEVPAVDVYDELRLNDTHALLSPHLALRGLDGPYDLLLAAEAA